MAHFPEAIALAPKFRPSDPAQATAADCTGSPGGGLRPRREPIFSRQRTLKRTDAVVSRLLELEPLDPKGFHRSLPAPTREPVAAADSEALVKRLLTDFPNDPRSVLIAGWYQRFEGKPGSFELAHDLFCQAAGIDPVKKDPSPSRHDQRRNCDAVAAGRLKEVGDFDSEFLVLKDAADRISSLMIEQQLLRRHWQESEIRQGDRSHQQARSGFTRQ
jgi:hypothetical protein